MIRSVLLAGVGLSFLSTLLVTDTAETWADVARKQPAPQQTCRSATIPTITSVSQVVAAQTQTITLAGTCFGAGNTFTASTNYWFQIKDKTAEGNWNGCHTSAVTTDLVRCTVTQWTNTQIVFTGFSGPYGGHVHKLYWELNPGDRVKFSVWNLSLNHSEVDHTTDAGNMTVIVS